MDRFASVKMTGACNLATKIAFGGADRSALRILTRSAD
jgi:hypothetical protein